MSEGGLILPSENTSIEWKRYCLQLFFHPQLKLNRREAIRFAEIIVEWLEPEDIQPGADEWRLRGAAACEGVHLKIRPNTIILDAHHPTNNLEFYEHRFAPILEAFKEKFSPDVVLRCNVVMAGLVELPEETDATSFLGGYIMGMHPNKLDPIGRPLHVLGVRLLFPPYEQEKGEGESWGVDVRVESAINDGHKLFLEADADWLGPEKWDSGFVDMTLTRLGIVSSFMSNQLVKFLRQPPFPEDELDNDDEQ